MYNNAGGWWGDVYLCVWGGGGGLGDGFGKGDVGVVFVVVVISEYLNE